MATFVFGTSARTWMDGKQAACTLTDITMEAELDEAETTTLCSTIKDYIPGLAEVTIDMEGLFDTNTASPATTLDAWLDARFGTVFPMTFAPEGGSDFSDPAYIMNGFLQDYKIENTIDEAASTEMTFRCQAALARGKVIKTEAAPVTVTGVAGTGIGVTVLDNTTSSLLGGVAVLQVSAVSGTTPSATFRIEHSVDNTTYTTLATFPAQTAINGEYLVIPAGTVNRYVRAAWTVSGTTPSFTVNLAFKRN